MSSREKVNFMGIDFEVLTPADLLRARTASEKPMQLCVRVADVDPDCVLSERHRRERQQLPCERCNELCWFDAAAGPGRLFVHLVCIPCVVKEAQEGKQ